MKKLPRKLVNILPKILRNQKGFLPGLMPAWGGFPTAPPMTGLFAWWVTPTGSYVDGNAFSSWTDSVNSYTLGTGAGNPTYRTITPYTINGIPVGSFPSDNKDWGGSNDATFALATAASMYVVGRTLDPVPYPFNNGLWSTGGGTTDGTLFPYLDGKIYEDVFTTVRKNWTNTVDLTVPFYYGVMSTASNFTARINGAEVYTTATNTFDPVTNFTDIRIGTNHTIGGDFNYQGVIGEILVYDHVLDATEIATLESYLSHRWNIVAYTPLLSPPTTNLQLWLDASQESHSDSDAVATWTDLSGNGEDYTQSAAVNKPLWRNSAVTINGLPVMSFDGTNDFFVNSTMDTSVWTEASFFIVGRKNADPATNAAKSGGWKMNVSSNPVAFPWTDSSIYDGTFSNSRADPANPTPSMASPFLYTVRNINIINRWESRINATRLQVIGDNVSVYQGTAAGTNTYIGKSETPGANNYDGVIAEILIYDKFLQNEDRYDVEQYLINKYAIT